MSFKRYESFVKPLKVSTLNRMYVEFIANPTKDVETIKSKVGAISEFLFGQKDVDFDLDVLRNSVFSDNQLKFIELVESSGEELFFRLNKYNCYEPYILVYPLTVKESDEPFYRKFRDMTIEQNISCVQEECKTPLRGLYNGKWADFISIIAVQ